MVDRDRELMVTKALVTDYGVDAPIRAEARPLETYDMVEPSAGEEVETF